MAIMGSVVFIHPNDYLRMLKKDPYVLDILSYNWHEEMQVNEINGIVYRQTPHVPEALTDDPEDYSGITKLMEKNLKERGSIYGKR